MLSTNLPAMDEVMMRHEAEAYSADMRARFPEKERKTLASVVGSGLIQISGQFYDSIDKVGSDGDIVEVINAGRPGSALYANAAVSASMASGRRVSVGSGGGGGGSGGGGGATDHGLLLGLGDDDHPHYYNTTRGDARYVVRTRLLSTTAPIAGGGDLSTNRTISLTLATDSGLSISGGLRLGTPSTLTVSTTNSRSGTEHAHAITALATSGATETLLKTDGSGFLSVVKITGTSQVVSPTHTSTGAMSITTGSGNLTITPATGITDLADLRATTRLRTPLIDSATSTDMNLAPGRDLLLNPVGLDVIIDYDASFRSSNYTVNFPLPGFKIGPTALAGQSGVVAGRGEFDELHARIFVADETRVDRGQEYITKSYGILLNPFDVPASGGDTAFIYFENSPHILGEIFSDNDWIMLRWLDMDGGIDLSSVWGQVDSYFAGADYQRWTFTLRNRGGMVGDLTFAKGALAVNFGQTGQGFILSDAISTDAPFVHVGRWDGANPYTPANYTIYAQMGRLDGVGLTGEDGFWAGTGTTTADSYFRGGASGVELWNAPIRMYDSGTNTGLWNSNGEFFLGFDGIGTAADRDLSVSLSGYVRIGRAGTNKPNLYWDEAGGALSLRVDTSPVITMDTSGNSYFAGVMTIGTSGEIRQGTGTLGSNYTGLRIWRDSSVGRIAGYNSNTLQWYAGTDGRLYAGGGAAWLDEDGLSLSTGGAWMDAASSVSWRSTVGGIAAAGMTYYISGSVEHLQLGIDSDTNIDMSSGVTGQVVDITGVDGIRLSSDSYVAVTKETTRFGTTAGSATTALQLGYGRSADGAANVSFFTESASATTNTAVIQRSGTDNGTFDIVNTGTGSLRYRQENLGAHLWTVNSVEVMRIHTDERVGIGTASPDALLDVDGFCRALSFYADDDGGSVSGTLGITNVSSTTISTGVGSIRTSGTTARTNTHWIKVYAGTTTVWIPAFTTITG
jgi:hypothetical protein